MKKEVAFLIALPLLVFIAMFAWDLRINYLTSLLIFFGIPSFYLSLKNRHKIRKVALFSLFVSIPTALIFELFTYGDRAWNVPESVLPYRLFGFIPLEDFIWMFITMYVILIFYEHYSNTKFQTIISPRIKTLYTPLYSVALLMIVIYITQDSFLVIPYAYLWLCIVFFFIPITLYLWSYPSSIARFFPVQMFFFYIHFLFELVGLKLNHWTFPGEHYLGWISFLSLSFPIEEFFFVILWGGFAPLVYYEYFANKPVYKTIKR